MSDASVRGRFLWHELLTTNTTSAAGLYTKLIGWKTQGWEHDPKYTLFMYGPHQPMAGLMALPAEAKAVGAPPNWLSYIGTPDVDDTVRQAVAIGGKVLKAAETVPIVGRFAVLQDPQGAVFGVYTPETTPKADGTPGLGDFSWHELATTDWRAALSFYQRLFGWAETNAMDMGPDMGTYQMYGLKGSTFGGMFNKPAQMPGPPHWLPYIKVADSKKVAAMAGRLGAKIVNGPMEVPGGDWIAQGMDLEGAVFAVHSVKSAAAAPAPAAKPAARTSASKAKPKAKAKTKPKAKAKPKAKPKAKKKARPAKKKAARKAKPRRKARAKSRRR